MRSTRGDSRMKARTEESDTPLGDELRRIFDKLKSKGSYERGYTYYGGKRKKGDLPLRKLIKARPEKLR